MVHKTTKKMYDDAHLEYRQTTDDYVRVGFEEEVKNNPRKYAIHQFRRVKQPSGDKIVYFQTIISTDFLGNKRECGELVGVHPEPEFTYRINQNTGQREPTSVENNKTVYDIPATKQNIQSILDGIVIPETAEVYTVRDKEGKVVIEKKPGERLELVETEPNFTLVNYNVSYGGFTEQEFLNYHFDDLLYKAGHDIYPETLKPFGIEEPRASKGFSGKLQQPRKDLIVTEPKPEDREAENRNKNVITSQDLVIKTQYEQKPPPERESPKPEPTKKEKQTTGKQKKR